LDLPKSNLKEIVIDAEAPAVGKRIVDMHIPKSAFIIIIKRDGEFIRPGGATVIQANDVLSVLADSEEDFDQVQTCLVKS